MWLFTTLPEWQRNNANVKWETKNEEFVDDMEWQKTLADIDPDMETVMVIYWLSISNPVPKHITLRIDYHNKKWSVYVGIGKLLHKMFVEYVHSIPHSEVNYMPPWTENPRYANLTMRLINHRMTGFPAEKTSTVSESLTKLRRPQWSTH